MALLVLKVILTPLLIGGASLAACRWGPLVALFLALERGLAFAAAAAHASLAACLPIAIFALTYASSAPRGWRPALGLTWAGWLVGALAATVTSGWPAALTLVLAAAALWIALAQLPTPPGRAAVGSAPPHDLVARMATGLFVVVGVTAIAPFVGATTSGLLAMLPAMGTVLAVFAQHTGGPADSIGVWRGILSGLFGTAAFLAVLALTLAAWGTPDAFLAALAAMDLVQALALRLLRSAPGSVATTPSPPPASQPV